MSTITQEESNQILASLPNEFNRKQALRKTINAGYSQSWLYAQIEVALIKGHLKRIGRGKYRKTLNHTQ